MPSKRKTSRKRSKKSRPLFFRIHPPIITALLAFIVSLVSISGFHKALASQPCVVKPNGYPWSVNSDKTITGSFTVTGDTGCTRAVSVMSWNANSTLLPDSTFWTTQTVYKVNSSIFNLGNHTLTVALPVCANNPSSVRSYQADIIASGSPSSSLSPPGTGSFYDQLQADGSGIVVASIVGDGSCPNPTPAPTVQHYEVTKHVSVTATASATASCPAVKSGNPVTVTATAKGSAQASAESTISQVDANNKADVIANKKAKANAQKAAQEAATAKAKSSLKCTTPTVTTPPKQPPPSTTTQTTTNSSKPTVTLASEQTTAKITSLPNTGPASTIAVAATTGVLAGLAHHFNLHRRAWHRIRYGRRAQHSYFLQ